MPAIRKMKALIKGEEFDQNISDEQTLVNNSSWFSACAVRTHRAGPGASCTAWGPGWSGVAVV